jgi:hypothetical protein
MWFMMIVKASKDRESGKQGAKHLPPEIAKFNDDMRRAGVLVELSRLHPSSKGARVKFSGGKTAVTDGPFAETKEQIGGYWIIQVSSMDEAIAWAKRVPFSAVEGVEGEIEIRQFLEMEDFVPGIAAGRDTNPAEEFAKTQSSPREGVDFASFYST